MTPYQAPTVGVIVALVGATIIITRGSIFRGLQESRAGSFFSCSLCVGWWMGAVGMAVLRGASFSVDAVKDFFLDGCSVSILSFVVTAILIRLLDDPPSK